MQQREQCEDLRVQVVAVEERVAKLESLMIDQMKADTEIKVAMAQVMAIQKSVDEKISVLIDELQEPLEYFRQRKYGMSFMKQKVADFKYWLAAGAALLGVLGLAKWPSVEKLMALLLG